MKGKAKPFVINLIKTDTSYTFDSSGYAAEFKNGKKNVKTQNEKNTSWRPSTRLVKELSLGSQLPSVSEEPLAPLSKDLVEPVGPAIVEELEDDDLTVEVQRETKLPQSPAKWFSLQQVHEIQRAKLPQFFNNDTDTTSQLYLKLRNFIVISYRKNPLQYLTKISCRRILRGDANTIIRIHNFLENEGIINFGVAMDGLHNFKPSFINKTQQMKHLPQSNITEVPAQDEKEYDLSLQTDNLTFSVVNKPFSRTFRVYCSECRLICGISWYSSKVDEAISLCFGCYSDMASEAKQGFNKVDIIQKINCAPSQGAVLSNSNGTASVDSTKWSSNAQKVKRSTWSIEDNIKLLELMSHPGMGWEEVVRTFEGKKGVQDIILQFMQFPITNFLPTEDSIKRKERSPLTYSYAEYVNNILLQIQILQNYYQSSRYSKEGSLVPNQPKLNQNHKLNRQQQELDIFPLIQSSQFSQPHSQLDQLDQLDQPEKKEPSYIHNSNEQDKQQPHEKDNVCKMVSLLLTKYHRKMENLKIIEQTIERGKDTIVQSMAGNKLRKPDIREFQQFNYHANLSNLNDNDSLFPSSNDAEQQQEPLLGIREDDAYSDMLNLGGDSPNNR